MWCLYSDNNEKGRELFHNQNRYVSEDVYVYIICFVQEQFILLKCNEFVDTRQKKQKKTKKNYQFIKDFLFLVFKKKSK